MRNILWKECIGNYLIALCNINIFVSREILTISLNDDGFAYVEVYYELLNNRQEKKQMVGFGPNR